MSNNQNPSVTSNVTSDGQGHYVVYHEVMPSPSTPSSQQLQTSQQFLSVSSTPVTTSVSAAGVLYPRPPPMSTAGNFTRPRILARGTAATAGISSVPASAFTTMTSNSRNDVKSLSLQNYELPAAGEHQSIQIHQVHSPQVLSIMDQANSANFSSVIKEEGSTGLTIYSENAPCRNDKNVVALTSTVPEAIVNTNYTTLTSIENYNMNNIYVETLPPGLDPNTVIMSADNQLFNIQNNGGTVLFCPSSISGEQGGINLLPIIDASNPGTSSGQIHFPMGEVVSGNNIFELITLPSDSTITSFSDQPIMNLSSGTNYGPVMSVSQRDPTSPQLVYTISDDHTVNVSAVNPPLTVVGSSSALSYVTATPSPHTTMAPSGGQFSRSVPAVRPTASNRRTVITVVDDFSDLIKTLPPGENNWGLVSTLEPDQITFESVGDMGQDSSRESSESFDRLEAAQSIRGSEGESLRNSTDMFGNPSNTAITHTMPSCTLNSIPADGGEDEGIMVVDDYYEEVKEVLNLPMPITLVGTTSSSNFNYTEKNTEASQSNMWPNMRMIESKNAMSKPRMNVEKRKYSVRPRKHIQTSKSTTVEYPKSLIDYTSITLRNNMERLGQSLTSYNDLALQCVDLGKTVPQKVTPLKPELPKAKVVKSKPKATPPMKTPRSIPRAPPVPPHIIHGLSKPVERLQWADGVGTVSGLIAKFRINEVSGVLEMFDYNPLEHQRRIPLKTVKGVNTSFLKKRSYLPRLKTFSKIKNQMTVNMVKTVNKFPRKQIKVRAKVVVPPRSSGEAQIPLECSQSLVSASKPVKDESSEEGQESHDECFESVAFCIICGTLASLENEFSGRKCKSCFEATREVEDVDESPSTKFKIPKGITIVKTSKRLVSQPSDNPSKPRRLLKAKSDASSSETVFAKKSNPLPIRKTDQPSLVPSASIDSTGITVVPILQTPSPAAPPPTVSKPPTQAKNAKRSLSKTKRRKYRRNVIEQRKLKSKLEQGKDNSRKRTFEKVLNTKTSYVTKSHIGSGSISDTKSAGATSESDDPSSKQSQVATGVSSSASESKKPLADFNWTKYLQEMNAKGAPPRFFRQPAFPISNPFKIGMMLEAVDPQHQSLFCVACVVDVQGHRLRLHLTGYSEMFDFWVNADSYDIFPPGWCEENGYTLAPPPTVQNFNWHKYLIDEQLIPAERECFAISKEAIIPPSDIQVGMKLEAVDIRNMTLTCVATVQNIINERLLIHFDSWDCIYDYWTDTSSPYIHPVGYCKKNGIELTPPKNYRGTFSWDGYLEDTKSLPVPSQFIRPLPPIGFKKGMKLECVDKRNPFLIRVATVADVEDHQLLIHFDGWSSDYDFKVYECSGDIHPTCWCGITGHPLQIPPDMNEPWTGACNIFGCLGLGHIKGYKFLTHNTEVNCPYSQANLKKDWSDLLPDRFVSYKKSIIVTQQHENSNALRRGSLEYQTTFARAAKLRSEKRKSETVAIPPPPKRKYTKRKSVPSISTTNVQQETAEIEVTKIEEIPKTSSLLHKRLIGRPSKTSLLLSNLTRSGMEFKVPLSFEPAGVSLPEVAKRLIIPNIESTITPVIPPSSISSGGLTHGFHWEEIIDSVVKDSLKRGIGESNLELPEFILPSSTTMTPIPTPGTSSLTMSIIPEPLHPKLSEQFLMMYTKPGSELTISQCTNDSSDESASGTNRSSSPSAIDFESDLPTNFSQNVKMLQDIVGTLNQASVSKWKTKDVVGFIRKIPGCLAASALFGEHKIDGEAFLLMTLTDFSEIMGLKMGPSIKLSNGIRLIQKNSALPPLSMTQVTVSAV